MKAKVSITPKMMERLVSGKPLVFRLPKSADSLEVVLAQEPDLFAQFDRVFSKVWKAALAKLEKVSGL